jgi:hypothetical protein
MIMSRSTAFQSLPNVDDSHHSRLLLQSASTDQDDDDNSSDEKLLMKKSQALSSGQQRDVKVWSHEKLAFHFPHTTTVTSPGHQLLPEGAYTPRMIKLSPAKRPVVNSGAPLGTTTFIQKSDPQDLLLFHVEYVAKE